MGLGVLTVNAKIIPDELFLIAAKTLAELVTDKNIHEGAIYPRLTEIRTLSIAIAVAVAEKAYELGIARNKRPRYLKQFILEQIYNSDY